MSMQNEFRIGVERGIVERVAPTVGCPWTIGPECQPPTGGIQSKTGPDGDWWTQVEFEPGRWRWEWDSKRSAEAQQERDKRHRLMWAMRSRVLTDEEMALVERYGTRLNIDMGVNYKEEEKRKELNDLLFQQFRLRAASKKGNP